MTGITFTARGHPNISARHTTTLMITRDPEVGPRGDCVVGVSAEKSLPDLPEELKEGIRAGRSVVIRMMAGGVVEVVRARGHHLLPLSHPTDMVVRKSGYVCARTLAVYADKSSADLSRKFVRLLRSRDAMLEITVEVL